MRKNDISIEIEDLLEPEDFDLFNHCQPHPQGALAMRRVLYKQQSLGVTRITKHSDIKTTDDHCGVAA